MSAALVFLFGLNTLRVINFPHNSGKFPINTDFANVSAGINFTLCKVYKQLKTYYYVTLVSYIFSDCFNSSTVRFHRNSCRCSKYC